MDVGLVDHEGRLLWTERQATPAAGTADQIWRVLAGLVRAAAAEGQPLACGVGCGGPMAPGGELVSPLNIPGWRDFPLRARLAECTGLPTWVDNDAKALALR